jgi:hypothetical protein
LVKNNIFIAAIRKQLRLGSLLVEMVKKNGLNAMISKFWSWNAAEATLSASLCSLVSAGRSIREARIGVEICSKKLWLKERQCAKEADG